MVFVKDAIDRLEVRRPLTILLSYQCVVNAKACAEKIPEALGYDRIVNVFSDLPAADKIRSVMLI